MVEYTKDLVIKKLESQQLNPVLDIETGNIFISVYLGMGNAEPKCLSLYPSVVRDTITELHALGILVCEGEPFVYCQHSPLCVSLKMDFSIPF